VNPETHLPASWVIGAKATDNERDCRLVALAGILPDADGPGAFSRRLDRVFVEVLRKWYASLTGWRKRPHSVGLD